MKTLIFTATLLICTNSTLYGQSLKPLVEKDTTNPREKMNTLFVFVGEKIFVKRVKSKAEFDIKYKARYKVIQSVYGLGPEKTIDFEVYSHKGFPAFAKYKHVLLYVSKYEGKYIHEKYQYNKLYKTTEGSWASPFSAGDYSDSTKIKPIPIIFKDSISFDLTGKSEREIEIWYPSKYYKITNNTAIPTHGNYVREVFLRKKEGVLKARELF